MFIGDLHWRGDNPPFRLANYSYRDDIKNCTLESLYLAEKEQCECVVLLGDIFDTNEPSGSIRNEVIDIFNYKQNGEKWPFEIYAIIGNHDIVGHSKDTLYRTALGTLSKTSVKIVDQIDEYSIYCGHYNHKIEHQDHSSSNCRIYALHANILPQQLFDADCALISEFVVGKECQLVVSGHYHPGYEMIRRQDGVLFCNPGSISRDSATISNIERDIQVVIATINEKDINVKYHKLRNIKPGNEIFDLDAIFENKELKKDRKFLSIKLDEIRNTYRTQGAINPMDEFISFCNKNKVGDDVIQLVLNEYDSVVLEQKRKN
jgi:exonuclease SbcD